jgi:hypothetical protein
MRAGLMVAGALLGVLGHPALPVGGWMRSARSRGRLMALVGVGEQGHPNPSQREGGVHRTTAFPELRSGHIQTDYLQRTPPLEP